MQEHIIKLRFGLTIDKTKQMPDPCPKCGRVVCKVVENDDDVFCLNSFCDFHDVVNHSHYQWMIERIERDALLGDYIMFSNNSHYPGCNTPFMVKEDFKNKQYIIRDLQFDKDKLVFAQTCGIELSKSFCVDKDSPIVARYYSLQLLVEDGWVSNHDRKIE